MVRGNERQVWGMSIPVFDREVCIGKGIMCVWNQGEKEYVRDPYVFCDCILWHWRNQLYVC